MAFSIIGVCYCWPGSHSGSRTGYPERHDLLFEKWLRSFLVFSRSGKSHSVRGRADCLPGRLQSHVLSPHSVERIFPAHAHQHFFSAFLMFTSNRRGPIVGPLRVWWYKKGQLQRDEHGFRSSEDNEQNIVTMAGEGWFWLQADCRSCWQRAVSSSQPPAGRIADRGQRCGVDLFFNDRVIFRPTG